MSDFYSWTKSKLILTVVAIATEEFVEPKEVRSSAKVIALGDEHLLQERITANDDALVDAQLNLVDVTVLMSESGEGVEWSRGAPKKMKTTDYRQSPWARKDLPLLVARHFRT